jgi:hypothetical protein
MSQQQRSDLINGIKILVGIWEPGNAFAGFYVSMLERRIREGPDEKVAASLGAIKAIAARN